MTSLAGLIFLMLAPATRPYPDSPPFVKTQVICKEIQYVFCKDGYPYAGINLGNSKDYLTNVTNCDILDAMIKKECK